NAHPTLKDLKFWTAEEKKTRKIDCLARSLLIQGLPNDIYSLIDSNETAKDLWFALVRQMRGFEYGEQDSKAAILSMVTRKITQNQGDANNALGYKKKAVVVHSAPLALVAEKTNVSKRKEKVVVSLDSEGSGSDDFSELKKITALLAKAFNRRKVKCYNCKKQGHFAKDCKKVKVKDYEYYKTKMFLAKKDKDEHVLLAEDQAWMESSSDSDQEINANMVFMAQIEKVLSDLEASSSSVDEKIYEVSYYLSESESESEFKTLEYYDNFTIFGLFVNNDDDQEIFHDAIESASENFIENHIDSQKYYDKSDVDRNDSEEKDHLVDKYSALFDNDKQHRKQIADQEVLFDKMSVKLVELDKHVRDLKNTVLEKDFKISELEAKDLRPTLYDEKVIGLGYVNEKINFEDDYFQDIINLDFEKIDSPFQQTSSLKPYVPNVILEKIIIDLEDEVVSLLEKEKANLETIESLKSKGFESSENVSSESENQTENDCLVVEKEYDKEENPKLKRKKRKRKSSKQNVKQVNNDVSRASSDFVHFSDLDTFSSVRRPKHSSVVWKKKGSSNTSNVDLFVVSHSNLNKNVKRYSRKDLLACNNSHLGETSSAYVCNDAINVSCNSRMCNLVDDNNFFIFDDESVRISPGSNMPFRKKPRDSMHVRSKSNMIKYLPRTVHKWLPKMQPLAELVAKWFPRSVQICLWIIDLGCSKHMTGNHNLLTNFVEKFLGTIHFGNNDFVVLAGYEDVVIGSMTIKKVYYVEGLGHNLFSVGQFYDKGLEVAFREDGVDLLTGDRSLNLYTIALNKVASNSLTCLLAKASSSQSWLWYQRLSYLNFTTINNLVKNNFVQGLPKMKFKKDHLSSACEQGKIHQKHHKSKTASASNKPLYLLYMDLCGPMHVRSINGKRYELVVDDYSRYTWVFFLHLKDEASEVIISFIKKTQVNLQLQVQRVQTDNGTKFKNKTLAKYFDEVGITKQYSTARTPQQNGVVERRNRTLVEAARTMLTFSNLPSFVWAEAIATACFTQNRLIIHKLFDETPYELINKRKPNIKFFRVFRCRCYLLNDYEAKGDIGVFVGYLKVSAAFRIYNKRTHKIHESMNVNFDELSEMASKQFSLEPGLSNLNEMGKSSNLLIMKSSTTNVETSINDEVFHKISESFQGESSSSSLNDDVQQIPEEVILPQTNTQSIPINMIPNGDEASTSHNVFNQRLEDAYFDAIRFGNNDFAVIAGYEDVIIGSMMIKKVYYVEGLGHNLFSVGQFCDKGLEVAFRKSTCFVRNEDGVDLLTGDRSSNLYTIALNEVASNSLTCLLAKASSSQSWLWDQRLSHLNFATINNLVKNNLVQVGKLVVHTDYQSMIGSLMYVTSSRPDIMFATCMCARYQANPNEHHVSAVKRIFRYLKGTINLGLWYPKDSGFDLTAYSEADHAGCHLDRKSTSGSVQFLGDKLVCWSSKKQNCVSISTARF
nr:hypothetical protein [Tanacetum cinerariifolium]